MGRHSWKKPPNVIREEICQKSIRPPIDPIQILSVMNLAATLRGKTGIKLEAGME
jgi:hypothetical protein